MYPSSQPSVHAPSMWSQGSLCKQFPEHVFVQFFPYVPELHSGSKYTYISIIDVFNHIFLPRL